MLGRFPLERGEKSMPAAYIFRVLGGWIKVLTDLSID
jgi:hypothetical protein